MTQRRSSAFISLLIGICLGCSWGTATAAAETGFTILPDLASAWIQHRARLLV